MHCITHIKNAINIIFIFTKKLTYHFFCSPDAAAAAAIAFSA